MSKRFKLYATIKENAGFQCPESWCGSDKKYNHALYLLRGKEVKIENCTFRTIKMRIKKFYRDSWNEEITDKNLIAWKHLLGID